MEHYLQLILLVATQTALTGLAMILVIWRVRGGRLVQVKLSEEEWAKRRTTPPWWWPETQSVMQLFLAFSIVSMVAYILTQFLSGEALKIDPSVRDLIIFIMGIVFGNFKDVYAYTFGSSAGEKAKGEVINKSLDTKDKIIADNVVTTAALAAGGGPPSLDALKAAEVVAPAAAERAAPPAAEIAVPPVVEKAVAEAMAAQDDPILTVDQLGETMLSNGELIYFRALPDELAKKNFLAMSSIERQAIIAKT